METGTDLVYEELPLKRELGPVLQKMKEHKENQNLLGKEVKRNGTHPHFPLNISEALECTVNDLISMKK